MLMVVNRLPEWQPVLFFSTIILWWAWARPNMLRDFDGRRLPHNTTARSIFMLFYLVAFAMLVAAFELFEGLAPWFGKHFTLNFASKLFDSVNNQGPLLSCIAMGGLLQIPFFRELERSLLVWLHSARHLHQDSEAITVQLMHNTFVPTADEMARNIATAATHGVHVTDGGLKDLKAARLLAVINWRKVATLLRLLRKWNDGERRTLSHVDMDTLRDIEIAHDRKTALAMTIIKMVEKAERGETATATVSDLLRTLSATPHLDRDNVAAVEARMKGLLSGQASEDFNHPLRLTADQLASYLTQIESYFKVEYELLLRQVAELTAKSIVLSGEQAAERMEQMKALGFDGFGQIEVINFDRVLWVFLFVAIVGFLVLVLGNPNMNQQQMEGTARFTFAMAFASLIGAVVGSRRRHTAALATPWGAYISAGIAAGLLYVGIQVSYGLARSLLPAGSGQMDPAILLRSLPWALLPCFVTLAICRLARQSQWPPPHLFHGLGNIWVRTIDGVLVSGALLIAYILAVEIIQMTDPSLMPPRIASAMQSGTLRLPIPVLVPLQIMGFIIGFSVVMDVRRAAHAKVVLGKDDAKASAVPVGATGVPA